MPITELDDNLLSVWVVAGVVLKKDGKYLLVQEKKESVYGKWNLPAGKVEKGQTIIEAAIREAKEETGYDIKIIHELGVYHKEGDRGVKHAFEGEIVGGELNVPEDEILQARWFTLDEIKTMESELRNSDWILDSVSKLEGSN